MRITDSTVIGANEAYYDALPGWTLVRDCIEGEERIKEQGEIYLPKLSSKQRPAAYESYKTRARFFNATERTLKGWTGSIFRKQPSVTAPASIEALLLDVDLAGTSFPEFCVCATEEVLTTGRCGVLVDHQSSAGGRPYLLQYTAEEIIQWGTSMVDGRRVLALVVLQYLIDHVTQEGAPCQIVEQRTLRLVNGVYQQTIERATGTGGALVAYGMAEPTLRNKSLNFIPFVFLSPKHTRPDVEKSPLIDIARTNVHHYTSSADWRQGLHQVALPTPYGINLTDDEDGSPMELGPGVFQNFKGDPNCKVDYLEVSGQGLELVRQDMEDLKGEMAALGASYVTPPKREAETAEALTLKSAEQNSPLAKIALSIEQGLTRALEYLATWAGADVSGVEVRLNKDFDKTRLSPADLKALSEGLQQGSITPEVYAYQLEQAEVLPPDLTAEQFAAQLTADKEARQRVTSAVAKAVETPAPLPAPATPKRALYRVVQGDS